MPSRLSRSARPVSAARFAAAAIANGDGCVAQTPSIWPCCVASAALAALLMASLATPAQAGPASSAAQSDPALAQTGGTLWLCHLSGQDTQLVCIAEPPAPGGEEDEGPASAAPATRATVHGTRFPLDPSRVYAVDLLAPATEADWLEQLARATVCYRSPGCEVVLTGLGDLRPPARGRLVRSN